MKTKREEVESSIKTELLMTMIQSVQYVSEGDTFVARMTKEHEGYLTDMRTTVAKIARELLNPLWTEYRITKNRPAELDDSEFIDWVWICFSEWKKKDIDFEDAILLCFGNTEIAVREYRDFSAGDPGMDGAYDESDNPSNGWRAPNE